MSTTTTLRRRNLHIYPREIVSLNGITRDKLQEIRQYSAKKEFQAYEVAKSRKSNKASTTS